jgi:hypothetical protein
MRELPFDAAAEAGRLLRVLFLCVGKMPADPAIASVLWFRG